MKMSFATPGEKPDLVFFIQLTLAELVLLRATLIQSGIGNEMLTGLDRVIGEV